jgi:hypothetical protein
MTIRQHYYTSCRHPESGRTGFQTRAASPNISKQVEQTLIRLLGYRLPNDANPGAVMEHPISLRYYTPGKGNAMLICTQSSGQDEFGRPGNFFAHSLVGDTEALTDPLAPIFYWRSPFWVRTYDAPQTSLPEIKSFSKEADTVFNFDALWPFVTVGQHREWLYRLICAMLDFSTSNRRIILLDSNNNIATWIALATMALPEQYRQLLTFATYHHEPYTVPFMITGTTRDSNFRFSKDEYNSYFVLNAQDGTISQAPDSDYARFIVEHFTEAQYEATLLDFFQMTRRRNLAPAVIEPQFLNTMAQFYAIRAGDSMLFSPEQTAAAARAIIQDVMRVRRPESADMLDLRAAWDILAKDLRETLNPALLADSNTALQKLRQIDPQFAATCGALCDVLAQAIIQCDTAIIEPVSGLLAELYPQEVVQATASHPDHLRPLTEELRGDNPRQLLLFWHYYGALIPTDDTTLPLLQPVFTRTCTAANQVAAKHTHMDTTFVPPEVDDLLKAWLRTQTTIGPVFTCVHEFRNRQPRSPLTHWIYYAWVEDMPLANRENLRQQFSKLDEQIINYELRRDLIKNHLNPAELANTIRAWVNLTPDLHQPERLNFALTYAWKLTDVDHEGLAHGLMMDRRLVNMLDERWQMQIMQAGSRQMHIEPVDNVTLQMYKQMLDQADETFDPQLRAVMAGAIMLTTGYLNEDHVPDLVKHFQLVDEATYQQEITNFFNRFLTPELEPLMHDAIVRATFASVYQTTFWTLYRAALERLLLDQEAVPAVILILDFWFNDSYRLYDLHPYLAPDFFMQLPDMLKQFAGDRRFSKVAPAFNAQVQAMPWFPVIAPLLADVQKSRGFLKGLFG